MRVHTPLCIVAVQRLRGTQLGVLHDKCPGEEQSVACERECSVDSLYVHRFNRELPFDSEVDDKARKSQPLLNLRRIQAKSGVAVTGIDFDCCGDVLCSV